jgi:chromosome segregation ATPase
MRTRYKILSLLILVSVALGIAILVYSSDNDDALRRFRLLIHNNPMQLLTETALNPANSMSVWYGVIALAAILMVAFVLKMLSGGEMRAFRERLVEMEVAKAELETLLQDSLWKEKHAREAQDAALKDLEASTNRAFALEHQLGDTEKLLKNRDGELKALRSQVSVLTEQRGEMVSAMAQGQGDSLLRIELRKKTDLLRAQEATIKELEKSLSGKGHALETQLSVKERVLQERDKELEALRVQLNETVAAKNRSESLLHEEQRKEQRVLQAKDAAIKELEKSLSGKAHDLEVQLNEKNALLQKRSGEVEALNEEVNALTVRLTDVTSVKEQAERGLQQEIKKITEVLRAKDTSLREHQESFKTKARTLEGQLAEQEQVLAERDAEIEALRGKVSTLAETTLARGRAENLFAQELKNELRTKDAALKELERKLVTKVGLLETELREKEEALQSQGEELEGVKEQVDASERRLADLESAKQRAEMLLQQEFKKRSGLVASKDAAVKELEMNMRAKVQALETQLKNRESTIKTRDEELEALKAQLGEMGSNKEEIENFLREELKKKSDVLEAKDSTIKELEESLEETVLDLANQTRDREAALKDRNAEIEELRSEMNTLKLQLSQNPLVPAHSETLPQDQAAQDNGSASKELEESAVKVRALQNLVTEKEGLLESRDEKIKRLESELKEKRTELARHEIAVWQSIERRGLWKQRLRKIGITLKE